MLRYDERLVILRRVALYQNVFILFYFISNACYLKMLPNIAYAEIYKDSRFRDREAGYEKKKNTRY